MSKKLFVGITNGLELWVDEQVLERLRQERASRLAARLNPDGTKINKKVTKPIPLIEDVVQNLLNDCLEKNGCWISLKNPMRTTYRDIKVCGTGPFRAHRFIYLLTRGTIDKPSVCHHCDNPPCCNPSHLFAGTQQDNTIDSFEKGRSKRPFGEDAPAAKLDCVKVAEIRAKYRYYSKECGTTALAKQYGVSQSAISKVVLGKRWNE